MEASLGKCLAGLVYVSHRAPADGTVDEATAKVYVQLHGKARGSEVDNYTWLIGMGEDVEGSNVGGPSTNRWHVYHSNEEQAVKVKVNNTYKDGAMSATFSGLSCPLPPDIV